MTQYLIYTNYFTFSIITESILRNGRFFGKPCTCLEMRKVTVEVTWLEIGNTSRIVETFFENTLPIKAVLTRSKNFYGTYNLQEARVCKGLEKVCKAQLWCARVCQKQQRFVSHGQPSRRQGFAKGHTTSRGQGFARDSKRFARYTQLVEGKGLQGTARGLQGTHN